MITVWSLPGVSHEALQKLACLLQSTKTETVDISDEGTTPTNEQDVDFTEVELLPPPPLYADSFDLYMN